MEFGVTQLSVIAVKIEPKHTSEIVTQLLFGELYMVLERKIDWYRIVIEHDNYGGWIHANQHAGITETTYKVLEKGVRSIAAELVQTITNQERSFPILMGSTLYDFDGINFKVGNQKFIYSGQALKVANENRTGELLKKIALKFLHAPYLWGGRSPFGIDCSGFTQIVFKTIGISISRDAYQQAEEGKTINFILEAKEGDLAFFDNHEGKITHVGIVLSDGLIIHASGKVRIDSIDHQGIFNKEIKKYTHKLRIIKRLM